MSPSHTNLEGLAQPGGCEQHPTAGRIGSHCLSCVIVPAPSGVDVADLLSSEAPGMSDRLTVDTITSDQLDALYATNQRLNQRAQRLEAELAAYRRAVAQWEVSERGTYIPHSSLRAIGKACGVDVLGSVRHLRHFERVEQAEAAVERVRALRDRWVKAGPPRPGTSVSRWWDARLVELHAAVHHVGQPGEEQAAPVDWQAIAKQRERELKTEGERRHAVETERDALREQLDAAHRRFDSLDATVYALGPITDRPFRSLRLHPAPSLDALDEPKEG